MSQESFENQVNSDRRVMGIPIIGNPLDGQSLTFNATLNAFVFAASGGVGDLEFLRDKELAGDLIKLEGIVAGVAPEVIVSVIPATGKTFFFARGDLETGNAAGGGIGTTSQIQNDGTVVDQAQIRLLDDTSFNHQSQVIADSLVGDGIKVYRAIRTVGASSIDTTSVITGWIQNT